MFRLVLLSIMVLSSCSARAETRLDQAAAAYRENRVAEAEALLARIIGDQASAPEDKARALRARARIAFLIDNDAPRALVALDQAAATGAGLCDTAIARARLLEESGQAVRLREEGEALTGICADSGRADLVRGEAAASALDAAASEAQRGPALDRARTLLAALAEEERTGLRAAALRLELALLTNDAAGALQAWKDYFWLREGDMPQGLEARFGGAAALFSQGLTDRATAEQRLRLVDLLVRAGFAQAGERFSVATGLAGAAGDNPLWTRAHAYFAARRQLAEETLAAYRRIARGRAAGDLHGAWDRAAARLVDAAGGGDRTQVLRSAYGLYGIAGRTGGFPSLHIGHVVEARRETVEQYAHRAEVGFIALDNMLSNGFQSWLWDGDAETGGWTEDGPLIVQIRSAYTSSPLNGWRLANGGGERDRLLARQAARAATDRGVTTSGRFDTLPGLADRLQLQVADQVMARVRATAQDEELKRAFLQEYARGSFQHSIWIHEGRHAIDRALVTGLAGLDNTILEYRAKLSELALADYPRLALFNIVSGNVGGGTSHGEANARIIREYSAWIEAHRGAVAGLAPGEPAMVQLDRLSDEQIKAIARGLDPIARTQG